MKHTRNSQAWQWCKNAGHSAAAPGEADPAAPGELINTNPGRGIGAGCRRATTRIAWRGQARRKLVGGRR